ncbi:putative quinol monooxygenase [Pikeienuella sp. HZG-20]|uniref:putative quinol monooxygenase n=1 Tax=Paludibacillus litoralis TaxID=3133267 RepID=UPI0030EE298B
MIVHTAHIVCRPEAMEAFKNRLMAHARNSMEREPGCLSFRFHQSAENPALFLLFETYVDQAAFDAHRATAHLAEFRADTAEMVISRDWWFWSQELGGADEASPGR